VKPVETRALSRGQAGRAVAGRADATHAPAVVADSGDAGGDLPGLDAAEALAQHAVASAAEALDAVAFHAVAHHARGLADEADHAVPAFGADAEHAMGVRSLPGNGGREGDTQDAARMLALREHPVVGDAVAVQARGVDAVPLHPGVEDPRGGTV